MSFARRIFRSFERIVFTIMQTQSVNGKRQPNSRYCFLCGMENPVGLHLHIYETAQGEVESIYIAPDHFQGYPGVLHGGLVAAIIDEISGARTWARSMNHASVTAKSK